MLNRTQEKQSSSTIDKITTHGRLKDETISTAKDVFPEPELPAMAIMEVLAQGGL